MFRPMRRWKQQITKAECLEILRSRPRGVLALSGDDGYPYAVPLDFVYDEATGTILFHGAKEGHKIDAMRRSDKASFCVLGEDTHAPGDWAATVCSVVVFGRMRILTDHEETIDAARRLARKYYPDEASAEEEVVKAADRVLCWELVPEHMTGKRVHEA